jgi:hypothetical protein
MRATRRLLAGGLVAGTLLVAGPAVTPAHAAPQGGTCPTTSPCWEELAGKSGNRSAADDLARRLATKGLSGFGIEYDNQDHPHSFEVERPFSTRNVAQAEGRRLRANGFNHPTVESERNSNLHPEEPQPGGSDLRECQG